MSILSKGFRRHIRKEKACIRREIFDIEEQKREIKDLCIRVRRRQD